MVQNKNKVVDSTFGEIPFDFRISTWAASDLYIDGKKIASFGNTGLNGAPYKENRFASNILPVRVNLNPGTNTLLRFIWWIIYRHFHLTN